MTSVPEWNGALWTGPRSDPHRYRVDILGEELSSNGGGEGLVFRAIRKDRASTEDVALKLLTTLPHEDYGRFANRMAALAEVDHPHVMRQIETFVGSALVADDEEVGDDEFEVIYSVAGWISGWTLSEAVAANGLLAGLRWVSQIASGVEALHAHRSDLAPEGIFHRDIKPSNVRIGTDERAVLIDFGTARPKSRADFADGAGTVMWRAPEVVGGPGSPGLASDRWGIGALAFWVLTGEPPRLEGIRATREEDTDPRPRARDARSKGFGKARRTTTRD